MIHYNVIVTVPFAHVDKDIHRYELSRTMSCDTVHIENDSAGTTTSILFDVCDERVLDIYKARDIDRKMGKGAQLLKNFSHDTVGKLYILVDGHTLLYTSSENSSFLVLGPDIRDIVPEWNTEIVFKYFWKEQEQNYKDQKRAERILWWKNHLPFLREK